MLREILPKCVYLAAAIVITSLPPALDFVVKIRYDIYYLHGKTDIAVVGSRAIRVFAENGINAVNEYIRSLE